MTDDRRLTTSDIAASDAHDAPGARDAREVREAREAREGLAGPLFVNEDADAYRARWSDIQAGFVDEPRHAVEEADALVAETMRRLAEVFAAERRTLESQWDHTDRVSTEDLRVAMRRYRSFFERLLSV